MQGLVVRLYPNSSQEDKLNKMFGCYRFIYNQCLSFKNNGYKQYNITKCGRNEFSKFYHGYLRKKYPWLAEQNTKVLKQAINCLDTAFKRFFKKISGYPNYKSKSDDESMIFPFEALSKHLLDKDSCRINLVTGLHGILFKCSDEYKEFLYQNQDRIKSITISRDKAGDIFASFLVDAKRNVTLNEPINNSIGIDLGINKLMVFSNGDVIENPRFKKKLDKKLKRQQRQLSKKKKGSKNRTRAKRKLAKTHQKIRNQKEDFINKLTTKIVEENQLIILEDLNIRGMMKNHCLAGAIQDLSWYEIKRQILYKAAWYGRDVVIIGRFFPSSKKCSGCGKIHPNLSLSDRIFMCPNCGLEIDRDYNAALNIEAEGLRIHRETQSRIKACGQSKSSDVAYDIGTLIE